MAERAARPRRPPAARRAAVARRARRGRVGRTACPGRRGGAGPSDAGFLWVRGLPLTVPMHSRFARALALHAAARRARRAALSAATSTSGRWRSRRARGSTTCRRPTACRTGRSRCCTSTRSPRPSCRSASTGARPSSARFCGIELTRGEQTIPVKTPGAARRGVHRRARPRRRRRRDADHRLDQPPRPRRALHLASARRRSRRPAGCRCRSSSSRPTTWPCSTRSTTPASTRSASTSRRSTPRCSRASRRARRSAASRATSAAWERAVEVFGRGRVTTYVILGMGERRVAHRGGLPARDRDGRLPVRRAAAAGARHADGRRRAAGPRLRRRGLPLGVGDARRAAGSTTTTPPRAARAARRARGCRRGSACSGRRSCVSVARSPSAEAG